MRKAHSILSFAAVAFLLAGCAQRIPESYLSATGFARIFKRGDERNSTREALADAEKRARDQILNDAMDLRFQNGVRLADAVVRDPFIRAKVYDTIRTAKVTDRTVNDDGNVSVTIQINRKRLLEITTRYNPDI